MGSKVLNELELAVRNRTTWIQLPIHLKQKLGNTQKDYESFIISYSLKNQLRYRGNLVYKHFRNEEKYYELLIDKSIGNYNLFPYHLSDVITKGLRVTPFNYYLEVVSHLLKLDKSYDTLPNFTAADILRVLGIGRNEYLFILSELKTKNSSKLFRKPNPVQFLPKFPVRIDIDEWWKIEIGLVIESDMKYVNDKERAVIDDLIDFGSQTAGSIDLQIVHSLYRKGLIYLDVAISGEDFISIRTLKNFIMNRVTGDQFESLCYKIFVTADEHMKISELANLLQEDLDTLKNSISFLVRLGFAKLKTKRDVTNLHESWKNRNREDQERMQVTPLNYHALLLDKTNEAFLNEDFARSSINENEKPPVNNNSVSTDYTSSSDGNASDFSFLNRKSSPDSSNELGSEIEDLSMRPAEKSPQHEKRVGFLFDSTLTAFLMMGNLSPGLKNWAVTMFEVGKLSEESMDIFLNELEKVSLLDAEGEGEVSRYFAHAIILRSTIIELRKHFSALDLIRVECLDNLDQKTRSRLLEKKYKFIISAAPLTLTNSLNETLVPFFGSFIRFSEYSHFWSKMFFYHICGYGPPSLLLVKGTVLKILPRLFLGYGKLLITIVHSDSYVINSENFKVLNDQLRQNVVLVQGYGIRQPGELCYEAFPFQNGSEKDRRFKCKNQKAIDKLSEQVNLKDVCGYITFVKTGVPDIGCEDFEMDVCLQRPKVKKLSIKNEPGRAVLVNEMASRPISLQNIPKDISFQDLQSPLDSTEITSFNKNKTIIDSSMSTLKSPDENFFSDSPQNYSPSNVFRSADCNLLLQDELKKLDENDMKKYDDEERKIPKNMVSQSSIEIELTREDSEFVEEEVKQEYLGEDWTLLEINFGIPLFDFDTNTKICNYIKSLARDENLSKIQEINRTMNEKFMKFISQCMYFDDENTNPIRVDGIVPPRLNLAFENGKICYWTGK